MKDICILVDRLRVSAHAEGAVLWGYDLVLVEEKLKRAGILPSRIAYETISPSTGMPTDRDREAALARLNSGNYSVIIPLDEKALQFTTGKYSIWKWHLSPLDTKPEFICRKAIPTFHPDQLKKEMYLGLYFEMALARARAHSEPGPWVRKRANYILNPSADEAIATLKAIRHEPWHSIDIETGRNQINTFGVAWSPSDAIAIKLLPQEYSPAEYYRVWSAIAELCESDVPKVMQNGIYERMYLSRYGIHINNFKHDTMAAMKFLWPELEKGLDNVGRIYTMEPYWKDDGRVSSEEGKQKDWGNIRDWDQHLAYNCKDTSNTLIAMHAQIQDLAERGLYDLYSGYIARLFDPVYEMGARGLPLNPDIQTKLVAEYEARSAELAGQLSKPINPRSPKQKLGLLRDKGYKLPVKRATGKESADELSLKQLRLKYPDDQDLRILLEVAGIDKALSSYLRVRAHGDNRIRFMLDCFSTETGRMSCSKDPWDRGFNIQTMNSDVKQMLEWPDDSRHFIEIDLSQAESRFVALDACEETLLGMIERKEDLHKFVAAGIYNKPMADITPLERQLGKKSNHGFAYSMGVNTFMDSCLKDDLIISRATATKALNAYHAAFPKIRVWHSALRAELHNRRKLVNPFGFERFFYGRMGDDVYRQAYAWKPQSTIPMITNHLLLALCDERRAGKFDFWAHAQIHDSVLLSARGDDIKRIAEFAAATARWHPEIILPAGPLIIPTDVKTGRNLGNMSKLKL